jgi:hypothetical protein
MPDEYRGHELRNRQIFSALLAVLLAIVYLRISQLGGRLAADLTFDDVGYANDAARRILMGAEHGLFAFVRTFVDSPPHSPFSTLLAVTAFAIGGLNDFAIYASNTLVLVAVATFVTYEVRHTRRPVLLLVLCVVLLSPIAYRTIHEFRPDIALGFTTAVMVWWFIGGLVQDDSKVFRRAGYAFGACLLIKPTFFAHTLAIAFFLACLALLARFFRRPGLSFIRHVELRELAWFLGVGIVIAAPYFVVNGSHVVQYFWDNTRGPQSAIWSLAADTSILDLLGTNLRIGFSLPGYHLVLSIAVLLLCGLLLFAHGAKADFFRIAAVFITAFASLCIILIGRHKNDFFFASFQWMLLLSAVYAIAALDQRLQEKGKTALLGASTAGLLLAIWMNGSLTHWHNSPEALHGASWNQIIVDLIRRHESRANGAPPAVFLSFAGPVSAETLRWLGTRQGLNLATFDHYISADFALAKSSAERAKYVVIPNESRADYYRWLPSAPVQSALLEWVLSNPRFKPLTPLSSDAHYFVFANAPLFEANAGTVKVDGIPILEGFLGEEGPYPQWSLPRVRWMNKETGKLCVLNSPVVPHRVTLSFRADAEGRFEVSEGEGTMLASVAVTPGKFMNLSLNYTPKTAKNCLEFSVQIAAPANPERLLLFSRIELHPE